MNTKLHDHIDRSEVRGSDSFRRPQPGNRLRFVRACVRSCVRARDRCDSQRWSCLTEDVLRSVPFRGWPVSVGRLGMSVGVLGCSVAGRCPWSVKVSVRVRWVSVGCPWGVRGVSVG